MAICNTFKKLTNPTGNILLFSQYNEDLTYSITHPGYYKVCPSKFIALNIDYSSFEDPNLKIPTILQNKFENGCAYARTQINEEWTPDISKNIFWNTLIDNNILSLKDSTESKYADQIKYVGDINLHSYNESAGMGYSEIYCFIPNTGSIVDIYANPTGSEEKTIIYSKDVIEGYVEEDYIPGSDMCPINGVNGYQYKLNRQYSFTFETDGKNVSPSELQGDSNNFFEFNTIVILYDILNSDGDKLYSDIPMGIYFCGTIDSTTTTSPIKKYISHEDIYNTGTSYGLRICSRFIVSPNSDNIKTTDITVNTTDQEYNNICELMSGVGDMLIKMSDIMTNIYDNSQNIKTNLAIFKNSRTNVPYIKEINKVGYWFINGKNTGYIATGSGGSINDGCEPYDDIYVQEKIDEWEEELNP